MSIELAKALCIAALLALIWCSGFYLGRCSVQDEMLRKGAGG